MDKQKFKKEVSLYHDEVLMAVSQETGEIRDIKSRRNNIPEGSELIDPKALFKKDYSKSWFFLREVLTPIEYKAAHTLSMLAKANTNSLEPLNDESALKELMSVLGVSINKVRPILNKLFDLGVYGKFEVYKPEKPYTRSWIFNPYLSFMGRLVKSDIANLFRGTHCEKAFHDEDYAYKYKIRYYKMK